MPGPNKLSGGQLQSWARRDMNKLFRELERLPRRYEQDAEPLRPRTGDIWVNKTGDAFVKIRLIDSWDDLMSITANKIENDAVHDHHINADVAGDGLTQDSDGALQVNPGTGIQVTGDAVATQDSEIDHGSLGGLSDDDHTQYHNDTRAETWHDGIGDGSPHHAAVTLGGGSATELSLNGQELTLAEVLTPTEHTAIGNSSPHHAPVTVGDEHSLTGQLLGHKAAATQTLAVNDTIEHGGARILYVTAASDFTAAGSPIIEAGTVDGQPLLIELVGSGTRVLTIPDSGNAELPGACALQRYSSDPPNPWLSLRWDDTNSKWYEVGRYVGPGNSLTGVGAGGWCAASTISGNYAIGVGYGITVSAPNAGAFGHTVSNAGDRAFAFGRDLTIGANADHCLAHGRYVSINKAKCLLACAVDRLSSNGDAQTEVYQDVLTVSGGGIGYFDIALDDETMYSVTVEAVVKEAGNSDGGSCVYMDTWYRTGGGNATRKGASATQVHDSMAGPPGVVITGTGGSLRVQCDGDASATTYWNVWVYLRKLTKG